MKSLCIFLFSLLSAQGKDTWKGSRSEREVGTPYGAELGLSAAVGAVGGSQHDHFPGTAGAGGNYLVRDGDGSAFQRSPVQPHVTTADDPVGFQAIRNYAKGANAAIETYGPGNIPKITGNTGAVSIGGVRVQGLAADHHVNGPGPHEHLAAPFRAPGSIENVGPLTGPGSVSAQFGGPELGALHTQASGPGPSQGNFGATGPVTGPSAAPVPHPAVPPLGAQGPDFDFNAAVNNVNNMPFGNSGRFISDQQGFVGDRAPSVFSYQAPFGGKDYNNLPHFLPPGGKTIVQLQADADEQLRVIIAKAHERQKNTLNRIDHLKSQYGVGTIGYSGWSGQGFAIPKSIDLGTHRGLDLGTSIDARQLITADGKLKLPVQNIHHTKTVGVKIPQPYPVKEEVLVPKPYPVNHYIKVPVYVPVPTTAAVQEAPQITITQPQSISITRPASQTISLAQQPSPNTYLPPLPSSKLTPPSFVTKFTNQVTHNHLDDDDDDSDESNEVTGIKGFLIQPSRSVVASSSLGLFPTSKPTVLQNSYGPPPSGPIDALSGFMGSAALASFPPFDFSQFPIMMATKG